MRDLADIDRALLRGVAWVAFDIDDTITEHGRLASRSLAAMEAMKASGLSLAAVTGRPLGWVETFMHSWPIDLGIGENGAGWFTRARGRVAAETWVPRDEALANARERAFAIGRSVAPEIPVPDDGWARRLDVAFDIGESVRVPRPRVDELDAALREAGFLTTRSSIHLHAAVADWSKARGLSRALSPLLGRDLDRGRDDVVYVGDSPNDASAFAYFPLSVGVANVRDHAVDPPPAYVTVGARSEGFAELSRAIVDARSGR